MMETDNRNPLTFEDIYNTINRNYEWESFKYVVPKHYHQGNVQRIPSSKSQTKLNYIDEVLKTKRSIPAPNAYVIQSLNRPLSGKMDKTAKDTEGSGQVKSQVPGPGAYFKRAQTAGPRINRNVPEYREHYLNEVEYLSAECPGVG